MNEIIFGTSNPAKIEQIRGALKPIGVSVKGIGEFGIKLDVPEDGKTAQENARIKASVFARALNLPILSMDNALYFDGLELDKQPGIHVRRIEGGSERPTDEELLDYYSNLIAKLGGDIGGHWEFALAYAYPDGKINETTIISPRRFVSVISSKVVSGYPLESIQKDEKTGLYIAEMSQEQQDLFWQEAIGKGVCEFVSKLL